MSDTPETPTEALGHAIASEQGKALDIYKVAEDDARIRHNDATLKIVEAQNEIHKIEGRMHDDAKLLNGWKEHLVYQQRRREALERKVIQARQFRRTAEDELSGIME